MKYLFNLKPIPSPMLQGSHIKSRGGAYKKLVTATITLTSLIDAFVIIVIYLVVCSSPSESSIDLQDNMKLPQTLRMNDIDNSPVIVFKQNSFFIDNNQVSNESLKDQLVLLASKTKALLNGKDSAIVVQADENVDFDKLQPLLVASAHAGIKQVKFAVLQKD